MSGQCFTLVEGSYEYSVCLFQNVTQRKTSDRFKAIIGTWDRWEVRIMT